MKKVKFSIVGFGHIGKRHSAMIRENPGAELLAVVDTDGSKEEELKNSDPVVLFFRDIKDFFEYDKNNSDVICICTPNGLHAPLAIRALEYRYHVVIEKPMALSKAECEQIIFKSLQVSRTVFVVKQNRFSPPSKWLKSLVDEKIIGDIHMVQINCYWNRDDRYYKPGGWKGTLSQDGGTLFTQFSHFIDIMYWIFGDIKNVQGRFRNFNHRDSIEFEDSGFVNFEFINSGLGSINFSISCWNTNMESSITVVGSKGSLKIGGQYMNEVEYCHIKDYELPELEQTNPPNDYGPYKGSASNHHFVIHNVVDTLDGKSSITTNALEGLKVVEIIERIYEQRNLTKLFKDKKNDKQNFKQSQG